MNAFFLKSALCVCCFKFSKVHVLEGQAIVPDFFPDFSSVLCYFGWFCLPEGTEKL